jgi:ACS family glucarate transporter-like MFS transporter
MAAQPTAVVSPGATAPAATHSGSVATTGRHRVVVFGVLLAVLAYVDRVAIAQAALPISAELQLSRAQMGLIFSAFGLAYALFEIPCGWLGDTFGPRRVLVRVVLWWSAFTAATGLAWSFWSLWTIRFLFGAGEAGCFPNLSKAFKSWLPQSERSRAQGFLWAATRWGGALTPLLFASALRFVTWRTAFTMLAAAGLVWCFFFYRWFADRPEDHPAVNSAELALIKAGMPATVSNVPIPWRRLVANRSVWLLSVQYFCLIFSWIFYITWLPTYLHDYHHQPAGAAARLAVIPLLFGGIGCMVAGFLVPRLARILGSLAKARRLLATTGLLGAACFLIVATRITDPLICVLALGAASFSNDLDTPPSWNAAMDVGGKYAGTVAGWMATGGHTAAVIAPTVGGYLLQRTHGDWNLFLYVMAAVFAAGALCWQFIDPVTSVEVGEYETVP